MKKRYNHSVFQWSCNLDIGRTICQREKNGGYTYIFLRGERVEHLRSRLFELYHPSPPPSLNEFEPPSREEFSLLSLSSPYSPFIFLQPRWWRIKSKWKLFPDEINPPLPLLTSSLLCSSFNAEYNRNSFPRAPVSILLSFWTVCEIRRGNSNQELEIWKVSFSKRNSSIIDK